MEELRSLLSRLGLPGATNLDEALLYPGEPRFNTMEFALARMLGDKGAAFVGLSQAIVEEEARISRLVEVLRLLGVKATAESVRGDGSNEERQDFLLEVFGLAATATEMASDAEEAEDSSQACSTMLSTAAGMQAALFAEKEELFPADIRKAMDTFGGEVLPLDQLEETLTTTQQQVKELHIWLHQHSLEEASTSQDWVPVESELQRQLQRFRVASAQFIRVFDEEFSVLAKEVPRPVMYGIGPAATRILHKYRQIVQMLQGVQNVRRSFRTMQVDLAPSELSWLRTVSEQCSSAIKRLKVVISVLGVSQERANSRAMLTPVKA